MKGRRYFYATSLTFIQKPVILYHQNNGAEHEIQKSILCVESAIAGHAVHSKLFHYAECVGIVFKIQSPNERRKVEGRILGEECKTRRNSNVVEI